MSDKAKSGLWARRDVLRTAAGLAGGLAMAPFGRVLGAASAGGVIGAANISAVGAKVGGASMKKPGPYRIGFSNGFSGNSWRAMCLASLKAEAAKHDDIEDLIIFDGQGDITKQVNDIQTLMSQQVDAILCIANSGTAVRPVLRQATRSGIVTVPFNLPVEGEDWSTYVGTDPENKGKKLGQWLKQALNGSGKIVGLGGLPGNSYTASAWKGTKEVLKDSDVEILAFKDAYWEEDRAKVVMADLIAAYPEIDGIWCDGGQDAAGAVKALISANRDLVPVTGDDYNGLLKLYHNEHKSHPKFEFASLSEPTWESVVALRAALSLLRGDTVPKRQIIHPQLITKDNYTDYMRADMPDGVFVDTNLSNDQLQKIFS